MVCFVGFPENPDSQTKEDNMPKLKNRDERVDMPLSIPKAAERWGTSEDWIRKQIRTGKLRMFRSGKLIRIRPDDLDALFTVYGGES